jgi:hypothetical protein
VGDVQASDVQGQVSNVSRPRFQGVEPESSAISAFKEYLSQAPSRADYSPSFMNRVGAALSGFGIGLRDPVAGLQATTSLLEQPYRQALEEYGQRGQRLGALAEIEASSNKSRLESQKQLMDYMDKMTDNERATFLANIQAGEFGLKQQQFEYTKGRDIIKDQQEREALEARGWESFTDNEGTEYLVNPITNERKTLGPSAKRTEMGIASRRAGAAETSAGAAWQNAITNRRELEEVGIPRVGLEGERVGISGRAEDRRERESAERVLNMGRIDPRDDMMAEIAAARELINKNPEYASYYDFTKGTINTGGWLGDENTAKQFSKKLLELKNEKLLRKYKDIGSTGAGAAPATRLRLSDLPK